MRAVLKKQEKKKVVESVTTIKHGIYMSPFAHGPQGSVLRGKYCYDPEIPRSHDFWVQILGAIFFHISVSSSVMLCPVLMFRATR